MEEKNNIQKQPFFSTRRITRLGIFCAAGLIMSLLESLLPPLLVFAPGAKMGLGNVITLLAIILLGYPDAIIVQFVRCFLGALITGGLGGLMYSVPAGAVSVAAMMLLYRFVFPKVSLMGISFVSAVLNNLTQVIIASIIVQANLAEMLPYYVLAGAAAGLFVGVVSFFVVKYLPKSVYLK